VRKEEIMYNFKVPVTRIVESDVFYEVYGTNFLEYATTQERCEIKIVLTSVEEVIDYLLTNPTFILKQVVRVQNMTDQINNAYIQSKGESVTKNPQINSNEEKTRRYAHG